MGTADLLFISSSDHVQQGLPVKYSFWNVSLLVIKKKYMLASKVEDPKQFLKVTAIVTCVLS